MLLGNIEKLLGLGARLVFRVPLIPGFNTDDASADGIAALAVKYGSPVSLLPFHRPGSAKSRKLGITYKYADTLPPDREEIKRITGRFAAAGAAFANV